MMKFKQKFLLIRFLILFLILGVISYIIFSISSRKSSKQYSERFETSSKFAFAKGISFVEYHGDRKVYSVSIDSLFIERAKLGPFAIGPLFIAHLNKVVIDLYLDGNKSGTKETSKRKTAEDHLPSFEKPISDIRKNLPLQFKKVKGFELKGISFNLWKNEKNIFTISSDSATIDRKTGDIVFTGHATMDSGDNGKLQSHRIRWDRKTHLFKILDPYYLIKDGRRTEGKGIQTDFLLTQITPIVSQK